MLVVLSDLMRRVQAAGRILLFAFCAALIAGCMAPQPFETPVGVERAPASALDSSGPSAYVIHPGDVLDVKFYYNDKLSDRSRVRPDGKITLQLVGDVQAAGLTPDQLRESLLKLYAPHQRALEIAVVVREFAGQKIYVGGEVNSPGAITTFENPTVFRAIFTAGGFKNSAEIRNVVVLRNVPGKEPLFMTLNLAQDGEGARDGGNFTLQPYDIVFVPKTTISRVGQFVDQYVKQIIPISFTVGFSWVRDMHKISQ